MQKGKVSCLLTTYNTKEKYLIQAIQSVLNQTYTNFEILIVDDGSDIPVTETLKGIQDDRITIYTNETNMGQVYSRNFMFEKMVGEFMAVLDGDDTFEKTKLEEQVNYLNKHPECDILACQMNYLSTTKKTNPFIKISKKPEEYKVKLFWQDERLVHSSIIVRSEFIKKNNVQYNKKYTYATDYGFYVECAKHNGRFAILNKYLVNYRIHSDQITNKHRATSSKDGCGIYYDLLDNLNITPTEKEKEIHLALRNYIKESPEDIYNWYIKLLNGSKNTNFYNKFYFKRELHYVIFRYCYNEYIRNHNKDFKKLYFKFISVYNIYRALKIKLSSKPNYWTNVE